jgi:hypothetical protein
LWHPKNTFLERKKKENAVGFQMSVAAMSHFVIEKSSRLATFAGVFHHYRHVLRKYGHIAWMMLVAT